MENEEDLKAYNEGHIHTNLITHPKGFWFNVAPLSERFNQYCNKPNLSILISNIPTSFTTEKKDLTQDFSKVLSFNHLTSEDKVASISSLESIYASELNPVERHTHLPNIQSEYYRNEEISSETEEYDLCDPNITPFYPSKEFFEALFEHQSEIIKNHLVDKRIFKAMGYYQELEVLITQFLSKMKTIEAKSSIDDIHFLSSFCQSQLEKLHNNSDFKTMKINHDLSIKILDSFSLGHLKPHYELPNASDPFKYIKSLQKSKIEDHETTKKPVEMKSSRLMTLPEYSISDAHQQPTKHHKQKKKFHNRRFYNRRSFRTGFRKASLKINRVIDPQKAELEGWNRDKGKFLDLAYRLEKNLSISLRVRGKLPCSIIRLLTVINEIDLAEHWAPYLKLCETESKIDKVTQVIRQVFDYPLIGFKESISFAYAVNTLQEFGCVMLFSVNPPEHELSSINVTIDPPKKKAIRIKCADLLFLIYPRKQGQKTTLELYANFYHGLSFVPGRIVAYIVKRLIKSMFVSIVKVTQNFDSSVYAERFEQKKEFYQWLSSMIDKYYMHEQDEFHQNLESNSLCSYDDESALE